MERGFQILSAGGLKPPLLGNADLKSAASPDAQRPAIFPAGPLEADFKSAFHQDAKPLEVPLIT
jgi:hypothetical protein